MTTISAERQRFRPQHRIERQCAIEMRKQCAATGGLPLQTWAKRVSVYGDQQEVVDAGEMFGRRFNSLVRRGKMNVAVIDIDRGAGEDALPLGLTPQGGLAYFINRGGHVRSAV